MAAKQPSDGGLSALAPAEIPPVRLVQVREEPRAVKKQTIQRLRPTGHAAPALAVHPRSAQGLEGMPLLTLPLLTLPLFPEAHHTRVSNTDQTQASVGSCHGGRPLGGRAGE